jgi:hypothetical protein
MLSLYNTLLIDQTLVSLKQEDKSDDYLIYIKSISKLILPFKA